MMAAHVGTRSVDFAGTRAEAEAFVKEHEAEFPRTLTLGRGYADRESPNGDPQLFASYRNQDEMRKVCAAFKNLGWDLEAQSGPRHNRRVGKKEE